LHFEEKELVRQSANPAPPYLEFAPLMATQVSHRFTLRSKTPGTLPNPPRFPFPAACHVQAEQIHGNLVVSVGPEDHGRIMPQADALVSNAKQLTLTVRTADCGPVYLYDPVQQAIGLAHSGKKGTAANITALTIGAMTASFGTQASDLIVVLGPCIRPPDYEIDFAAEIGRQARAAGVRHYYDCGLNTAADLAQFYSYRMEQGNTGRHYAFLMLND
jgi:copper oxidase (laccase) domain-containing protein